MRGAYLRSKKLNTGLGGQRGGVGSGDPSGDYELEIGVDSHASPELMALCQIHDEIIEYLDLSRAPLAKLILQEYRECRDDLKKQLAESERNL